MCMSAAAIRDIRDRAPQCSDQSFGRRILLSYRAIIGRDGLGSKIPPPWSNGS